MFYRPYKLWQTFASTHHLYGSVRWFARNSHIRGTLMAHALAFTVSIQRCVCVWTWNGMSRPGKRKQTLSHLSFGHVKIVNFRPKYETLCKVYGYVVCCLLAAKFDSAVWKFGVSCATWCRPLNAGRTNKPHTRKPLIWIIWIVEADCLFSFSHFRPTIVSFAFLAMIELKAPSTRPHTRILFVCDTVNGCDDGDGVLRHLILRIDTAPSKFMKVSRPEEY